MGEQIELLEHKTNLGTDVFQISHGSILVQLYPINDYSPSVMGLKSIKGTYERGLA
jgi:hypothetical protein